MKFRIRPKIAHKTNPISRWYNCPMLYWLLSLLAHTSNLHAIWIYAFLFLMYISMLYIYIYIKIVSIHAGMNWERNPVDAIQENQDRWMSKTSIGSPTGPSGSTDRKAGRLLKRLPDRCSDAVVGAADGSSVFFLSGSHCFKWLFSYMTTLCPSIQSRYDSIDSVQATGVFCPGLSSIIVH